MGEQKYVKAKKWIGKDLTLHVGGGDRKIGDNEVLSGSQYARFVGMGFLAEKKSDVVSDEASDAKSGPESVATKTEQPDSVMKSHANKVADAAKPKGRGGRKPASKDASNEDSSGVVSDASPVAPMSDDAASSVASASDETAAPVALASDETMPATASDESASAVSDGSASKPLEE